VKIAIVEDDINMRKSLQMAMGDYPEFDVVTFKSAKDALKSLDESFDLIVTDITMPQMDGLEFIKALGGRYEVIIMTGNATLQRAIESIHLGVKDFLLKPFEIETLVSAIKRVDDVNKVVKKKKPTEKTADEFISISKQLEQVLTLAKKASKTDVSVLLLGESGVGKEVLARYIHKSSNRAKKPFVAINMAALPDNLIESELFGYEKGAFTDAVEAKSGQFENAHGGTLFLDEIGEMPYGVQAKLLRALQEKEVRPLGSQKTVKIDVRIVSATNADLHEKIKKSEFREDLYYRLNTIPLHIPPLRERSEEILPIAQNILEKSCREFELSEKYFAEDAKEQLLSYDWPGNIRELISVVQRAAILSDGEAIEAQSLFLDSRIVK
jgi:two-component system, NtrC family, response regulator